jgi:hypothetical protein
MTKRPRVILRNMEFLLQKLPPSLMIRFMLIFMTRTIPLMSIGTLLWGNRPPGRLLIVSYTERDDVVRLISSREVTAAERRAYEEG